MINWQQLDRLFVFLEGFIMAFLLRALWTEVIPELKSFFKGLKNETNSGEDKFSANLDKPARQRDIEKTIDKEG